MHFSADQLAKLPAAAAPAAAEATTPAETPTLPLAGLFAAAEALSSCMEVSLVNIKLRLNASSDMFALAESLSLTTTIMPLDGDDVVETGPLDRIGTGASCPTLADNDTKRMLKFLGEDGGGNTRTKENYIWRGDQRISTGGTQRFATN